MPNPTNSHSITCFPLISNLATLLMLRRVARSFSTASHVIGSRTPPLLDVTMGRQLDLTTARFGSREALLVPHQGINWTYDELRYRVNKLAASFLKIGLKPGDRIGIWAPNCSEWVLTQLASAKAGLILTNINPAYRVSELKYALTKVGIRALVMSSHYRKTNFDEMVAELIPNLGSQKPGAIFSRALPDLKYVVRLGGSVAPGTLAFDDLSKMVSDNDVLAMCKEEERLDPHDIVNIQFTSGTTGSPKGAALTHNNIVNNGRFTGVLQQLSEMDKICIPVPLYHCFGMVMGQLACLTHGAAAVFPSEAFDADAALTAAIDSKCTSLYGVPTMFIAMLASNTFLQRKSELGGIRTGVMAGSVCPVELMHRVRDDLGIKDITIAYGMTETSPISFQTSLDDPVWARCETVGKVHPHVECRVVDESGRVAPLNTKGELETKGYGVMACYWGDENKTKESIVDGWMKTGDLAEIDEKGYCRIVGRSKDMVIRGGENVYPREIEDFLYAHASIEDVQVVGVPDEKYGEELCACVILKEGASATPEQLKEFCKGKIAHFKVPRYFLFVDSFPMTVTGKVQKNILRDQAKHKLNLHALPKAHSKHF